MFCIDVGVGARSASSFKVMEGSGHPLRERTAPLEAPSELGEQAEEYRVGCIRRAASEPDFYFRACTTNPT